MKSAVYLFMCVIFVLINMNCKINNQFVTREEKQKIDRKNLKTLINNFLACIFDATYLNCQTVKLL